MTKKEAVQIIDDMISVAPKNVDCFVLGKDLHDLTKDIFKNSKYKGKTAITNKLVDNGRAYLLSGSMLEQIKESCENFLNNEHQETN